MKVLGEIASILRSKNAGPLTVSFDIMFPGEDAYNLVKESGVLRPSYLGDLYQSDPEHIRVIYYDIAHAIKIAMPRRWVSGDIHDVDIYGCQQQMPLYSIPIPATEGDADD